MKDEKNKFETSPVALAVASAQAEVEALILFAATHPRLAAPARECAAELQAHVFCHE